MIGASQAKREPRDYQLQAVDEYYKGRARGLRRMMWVMATGTGKTFAFTLLAERIRREENARVLVLADQDELIRQTVVSLSDRISRVEIGIVKAARNECHYPVVVSSIQSIANDKQRTRRNLPQFDLIIVDECDLSLAKSYREVFDSLLAPNGTMLGVTATPIRTDGRTLAEVYEEIVFQMPLPDAIQKGWLCNLVAQRVKLKSDFSGLKLKKQKGGPDFASNEICSILDNEDWEKSITDAWLMYAADRKTLGFLPSVAFSHRLAEYMRGRGIRAVAIDGKTETKERQRILSGFGSEFQVLLNCQLLVKGVDLPSADCILSAAMTASLRKYMQSIGRGTRKAPGKENCLILDVVGVSQKNRIQQAFSLGALTECYICEIQSSLEYKSLGNDPDGQPAHACVQCHRQIECHKCGEGQKDKYFIDKPQKFLCRECNRIEGEIKQKGLRLKKAAEIEGFEAADLIAESSKGKQDRGRFLDVRQRRIGRYTWEENVGAKTLSLTLEHRSLSVVHYAAEGDRPEYYHYYSSDVFDGFEGRAPTRIEALRACEEEIGEQGAAPSLPAGVNPASSKQMDLLHKLRIPYDPNISSNGASKIIGDFFARKDRMKMRVGA